MAIKLTIDEVRQYFENYNYKLISTEYINSSLKLLSICPNGHEYNVSYNKFQQGKRCPKCSGNKKYEYNEVEDIFKINNCELLSKEYINNRQKLKYKCSCGNISEISLDCFLRGERCNICGHIKTAEKQKHSFDYVKSRFENNNYQLLSNEYNNYHELLDCICPKGHLIKKSLSSLDFGYDCYICADINLQLDWEYLNDFYKKEGCKLLTTKDEYKGVGHNNSLKYMCSCGNITQNTFHNFKNGERCWECAKNKKVLTNLKRYKVKHTLSDKIVWLKTREALYKNGNVPCSQQQEYIYKIIGGVLNYPIESINVDILLDNKNIIEYDGSGHNLSVKKRALSQEEFNKKEMRRNYFLMNKGYKMIRIISLKDNIPSDDILIKMLNDAKEIINSGRSYVTFDIDNSLVITSQYTKPYDFGKLRKIKEKDLQSQTA
jgi:very-short-patch-repair endonuclease